MRHFLLLSSLLFFALLAKGNGENMYLLNSTSHLMSMTGSGTTLNVNPLFNLDVCTGSGTIDLNFNPGITDMIIWNDGSTDVERYGLGNGEYFVDLTIDGCDTTIVFNLEFPDILTATVSNSVDKNCVTGTASSPDLGSFTVSPLGGEAPYIYSINNNIDFQTSNTFDNLEDGTYVVDITDANGCETQVIQEIRCVGCSISNNPVQSGSQFFVDVFFGDETETAELQIFNSIGRRVVSGIDIPVTNGEVNAFPVDVDLDAGMYTVLIIGDSISFSRQLVVVE